MAICETLDAHLCTILSSEMIGIYSSAATTLPFRFVALQLSTATKTSLKLAKLQEIIFHILC